MMVRVPRVARRRPRQIKAGAADGEFVGGELAEHDGAGAAQARDAYRIVFGDIVDQDPGVTGCGQTGDIDDVLDADRHPVQRPAAASRSDLGFRGARRRHRRVAVQANKDIQFRIEPANALQQRRHQFDRRQSVSRNRFRRCLGRDPVEFAHSPLPTRIGGHGSARGSAGVFIRATDPLACSAAAATSSGNSASALSRPARRASSSMVALSIFTPFERDDPDLWLHQHVCARLGQLPPAMKRVAGRKPSFESPLHARALIRYRGRREGR
jgi:hypothetical protein